MYRSSESRVYRDVFSLIDLPTRCLNKTAYLCKNLGVEEAGRHIFEGSLLAGDYGTCMFTWG